MARSAQTNSTAVTTWMIIFAALWLTSTVILIVLYTGQEDIIKENEQLKRVSAQLISSNERQSIELIRNLVDGGPTAVGILEDARRQTAAAATGQESDDPTAVISKRNQLVDEIVRERAFENANQLEGQSLLEIATALHGSLSAQSAQMSQATERVATLESELAQHQQQRATEQEGFEAKLAELREELTRAEAQHVEYRTERDKAIQELERRFETQHAQCESDLASERLLTADLRDDMEALKNRFSVQEAKFGSSAGGPEVLALAREPDGVVLSSTPGSDLVYINRGRRDRLTLGLRFAVYSAVGGAPSGRAKAQIEVIAILDETAECRVTSIAQGAVIVEGDFIANPIYDPDRAQQFVVIGEFDLNRDGRADPNGSAVIESLVTDWGGSLAQELGATTDFVVLGRPPQLPRVRVGQTLSPEEARQAEAMRAAHERYQQVLQKATSLSIPVLSQELFLSHLGYHARVAAR